MFDYEKLILRSNDDSLINFVNSVSARGFKLNEYQLMKLCKFRGVGKTTLLILQLIEDAILRDKLVINLELLIEKDTTTNKNLNSSIELFSDILLKYYPEYSATLHTNYIELSKIK